jgi:mRNA-degrading endonuclease RelE of RelBE toxin-antitoxin system
MLTKRVKQLDQLSDDELKKIGEQAKEQKDELNEEEIKKLHVKHGVGGKK